MMSELLVIAFLTFVIHLIGTLAYSVRIAGTRVGRIAISFSLFNILVLVSRVSNSFQAPLIAKRVEQNIHAHTNFLVGDFRIFLFAASLATVVGGLLTPTFQRMFYKAVASFNTKNTIPKLVFKAFSPSGLHLILNSITIPSVNNITSVIKSKQVPLFLFVGNTVATAIWTVGVFSALYAGYLVPEFRSTAGQLSSVINGAATILIFIFIDPYLSFLTDEVVAGKISQAAYRRIIIWFVASRLCGTVLAQLLLVPCAILISVVAKVI